MSTRQAGIRQGWPGNQASTGRGQTRRTAEHPVRRKPVDGPPATEMQMSDRRCACWGAAGKKALQAHKRKHRLCRWGPIRLSAISSEREQCPASLHHEAVRGMRLLGVPGPLPHAFVPGCFGSELMLRPGASGTCRCSSVPAVCRERRPRFSGPRFCRRSAAFPVLGQKKARFSAGGVEKRATARTGEAQMRLAGGKRAGITVLYAGGDGR